MEPMAGKLRWDHSTMNCAIWVTNESCDSAGRSSKILSRRTPETYIQSKCYGQPDNLQRGEVKSCLVEEYMRPQRMGVIELIGQDFRYRDRRPFLNPLHRCNLFHKWTQVHNKQRVPRKKRRTSDSMMDVGICESATRA